MGPDVCRESVELWPKSVRKLGLDSTSATGTSLRRIDLASSVRCVGARTPLAAPSDFYDPSR